MIKFSVDFLDRSLEVARLVQSVEHDTLNH